MKKRSFSFISGMLFLIIVLLITFFVVKKFRKPGSMTVLESQSMDMAAMTAPKGSFPVAVEPVKMEDIEEKVTYTGSVVPYNEQNVSPRVSGWLVNLFVYPGDKVSPGQVIARLNAADLSTQAKEVTFEVENKQSKLKYWESEIKRAKKLYDGGAISLDEYQMEESQYLSAKADLSEAQAKLNTAQIMRNYTEIESLISGVVTKRLLSTGTLVNPGAVIYQISQIDPIRLQANVAESDLRDIKVGNPVSVYFAKGKGTIETKISSVFPAVDPVSRTAVIEAVVKNPDSKFLPGQYIIMKITKSKKSDALTVPAKAIVEINGKPAVWTILQNQTGEKPLYTCVMHPEVISGKPGKCPKCGMDLVLKKASSDEKTAHLVYVTTGITNGERTEITGGLKQGDEIIYAGLEDIKEGDPVYPANWDASGPQELPPPPATEDMPGMKNMPGMKHKH